MPNGLKSSPFTRSFWRRLDVQLGLSVGAAIAFLLIALLAVLFFVASHEAIEMIDRTLQTDLKHSEFELDRGEGGDLEKEPISRGTAIRLVDASGAAVDIAGHWPTKGRFFPHRAASLRLGFAALDDHLTRRLLLSDGRYLEGAASLRDFVVDRHEQFGQITASLAFGLLGAIAIAIFATQRALEPLREATRQLESVDERHLAARLAVRGSGDDLDRHALALNRVFARLEESFRRVSAFSADVAHELRTPVNRALNLADVALLKHTGETEPSEVIAIRESMDDMRRLIERLLLLAKGDVGRLPLRRERVDLSELGNDLAELFRPSCEQVGVALQVDVHGDETHVEVDAGLVQQAISNLLDNAIRHSPDGGTIRLDVAADTDSASISVSDAGPGVPLADRERVFDRFVQLDGSRTLRGTGLGLAIARMIARLHGGDVLAAASALGGARFTLRVPRHPDAAAETAPRERQAG
jgi:signal transduction histidine kinase